MAEVIVTHVWYNVILVIHTCMYIVLPTHYRLCRSVTSGGTLSRVPVEAKNGTYAIVHVVILNFNSGLIIYFTYSLCHKKLQTPTNARLCKLVATKVLTIL